MLSGTVYLFQRLAAPPLLRSSFLLVLPSFSSLFFFSHSLLKKLFLASSASSSISPTAIGGRYIPGEVLIITMAKWTGAPRTLLRCMHACMPAVRVLKIENFRNLWRRLSAVRTVHDREHMLGRSFRVKSFWKRGRYPGTREEDSRSDFHRYLERWMLNSVCTL